MKERKRMTHLPAAFRTSGGRSSSSCTWRTSMMSPSCIGARFAHSTASSLDFTWIIQKPPTSSLDSVKGPSVTLGLPPANFTRAPFAGGCSPSSATTTPALVRDSLYFVILATSSAVGTKSAPAFSYPFGITSIMNRGIVPDSFAFEVRRRAHPGSMDASNESFGDRHASRRLPQRASSEAGGSRDQKTPGPEGDGPCGSRDALTGGGRCETFDGDRGRHDAHRAQVHDPETQENRHQTDIAIGAVDAEAQAVSPGRAGVRGHLAAPRLPATSKVMRFPRGELEQAGQQDDHPDHDRCGARQRGAQRKGGHSEHGPDEEVAHAHERSQATEAGLAVAPQCRDQGRQHHRHHHHDPHAKERRRAEPGLSGHRHLAQPLSYSSWRRHQTPVSLRPLGARSSHWYMPQRPSSPRA